MIKGHGVRVKQDSNVQNSYNKIVTSILLIGKEWIKLFRCSFLKHPRHQLQ